MSFPARPGQVPCRLPPGLGDDLDDRVLTWQAGSEECCAEALDSGCGGALEGVA